MELLGVLFVLLAFQHNGWFGCAAIAIFVITELYYKYSVQKQNKGKIIADYKKHMEEFDRNMKEKK